MNDSPDNPRSRDAGDGSAPRRGLRAPTTLAGLVPAEPAGTRPDPGMARRVVPEDRTERLRACARRHGLTLNTLVQGAWAILLARYTGEQDVVFGATVSGRPADLPDVERIVGLFINTLPVRVRVDDRRAMVPWLQELQERQVAREGYAYTPLVDIQKWSGLPAGTGLFTSLLAVENYPFDERLDDGTAGLRIDDVRNVERTTYPLTLQVLPGERLTFQLAHDATLDEAAAARLLVHLATLLDGIAAGHARNIGELEMLDTDERRQLVAAWNPPPPAAAPDETLHAWFARQAALTPDALALSDGPQHLSYRQLDRRANRLAHLLRRRGARPDSRVALCLRRSIDLVVALLATLKAGAAYLPLDPDYPADRLAFTLDDARARLVLTHTDLAPLLPGRPGLDPICLDTLALDTLGLDHHREAVVALNAEAARRGLPLRAIAADLERGGVPLRASAFDVVVVVHYLHRPLLPVLRELVRPGGLLIYETFTTAQAERGKPTNPDFLLEPGELRELMHPFEVLVEREGDFEGKRLASVIARRSPALAPP